MEDRRRTTPGWLARLVERSRWTRMPDIDGSEMEDLVLPAQCRR